MKGLGKRKREEVLRKTNGACFYCGENLNPAVVQIDHVFPQCKGGKNDIENLVPACRSCNSSKGGRSLEKFRLTRGRKLIGAPYFSDEQIEWLSKNGFNLPIPFVKFHFEK